MPALGQGGRPGALGQASPQPDYRDAVTRTTTPVSTPSSFAYGGGGDIGSRQRGIAPMMATGAGAGTTPSTGQLSDNPFQNVFNFQIPAGPVSQDTGQGSGATSGGGIGQYIPLIVVGVIVAGIGYLAFGRKG